MPTYPLAFPSAPNIQTLSIRPTRSVGSTQSPYDKSEQIFDHRGAQWVGEVTLPRMKVSVAANWEVFILQLRGRYGEFLMGPPLASNTGTGTGGDLSTAGAVFDESIVLQNAGAAATYKKADWLQIGTGLSARLHKITADATADGAGAVTLGIEPPLKEAYVTGTAVTVSAPVGVWRLGANDVGWNIDAAARFGFTLPIVEAL